MIQSRGIKFQRSFGRSRLNSKVRQMDLSYLGMTMELRWTWPRWEKLCYPSNFDLISLSKLDLSHNELHETPENIVFLPSLTHLFLNDNYLSSIHPEFIRRLVNLQELDLRNNKINDFSSNISGLSRLQRLSVQGNPLTNDESRKLMMLADEERWIDIAGECKIL